MLYDAVMVPFDGSDSARAALDEAVHFAKEDAGLALHVVQIVDLERTAVAKLEARGVDLTESVVPMGMQEAMEEATEEASERLHAQVDGVIRPLMNEKRVCLLPEVHPGDQIVKYAQENGCGLIIMGSRGQGGVKGFLGSVSYAVTKESPMTVLIAKEGDCR